MVAIADKVDEPILMSEPFRKFLPEGLRFVRFDAFDEALTGDPSLSDAALIVAAEPREQEMLSAKLDRIVRVANRIRSCPTLLYQGDFHTDLLELLARNKNSFEHVRRLEFQDDEPSWGQTIPEFTDYGCQAARYVPKMYEALHRPVILSATATAENEVLGNWSCLAGDSRLEPKRAEQMQECVRNWPLSEVDTLFTILPEGMDQSSVLVRRHSTVFTNINQLSVASLIIQRKRIGPPFEQAAWYLFLLDVEGDSSLLRNQDQAVLSEFTNKLLKYHHDLNDRVGTLLASHGCLESYIDISNVFQNAEFLKLHVSQDWVGQIARLRTVPPPGRPMPPGKARPSTSRQVRCELIAREPNRVVFWAEVADGLRVKTELPIALSPNTTKRFLWNPGDNTICLQHTEREQQDWETEVDAGFEEMDELDRRLGKEWE